MEKYTSPSTDHILAEFNEAGGKTLHSAIQNLILLEVKKNCHSSGWNLLLYSFIMMAIRLNAANEK
jgi:hypothetical protein